MRAWDCFNTALRLIEYLRSLQLPSSTIYIEAIFARRVASQRTSFSGNRAVFNQIRLLASPQPINDTNTTSTNSTNSTNTSSSLLRRLV
jgi:hypothetical protein